MKKSFLLIAGDTYYPHRGINDWIKRFDTYDEAELYFKSINQKMGFDWHTVVNLETVLLDFESLLESENDITIA